jgi:hypothetical protein
MCIILIVIKIIATAKAFDLTGNFAFQAKLFAVFVPEERYP